MKTVALAREPIWGVLVVRPARQVGKQAVLAVQIVEVLLAVHFVQSVEVLLAVQVVQFGSVLVEQASQPGHAEVEGKVGLERWRSLASAEATAMGMLAGWLVEIEVMDTADGRQTASLDDLNMHVALGALDPGSKIRDWDADLDHMRYRSREVKVLNDPSREVKVLDDPSRA